MRYLIPIVAVILGCANQTETNLASDPIKQTATIGTQSGGAGTTIGTIQVGSDTIIFIVTGLAVVAFIYFWFKARKARKQKKLLSALGNSSNPLK